MVRWLKVPQYDYRKQLWRRVRESEEKVFTNFTATFSYESASQPTFRMLQERSKLV